MRTQARENPFDHPEVADQNWYAAVQNGRFTQCAQAKLRPNACRVAHGKAQNWLHPSAQQLQYRHLAAQKLQFSGGQRQQRRQNVRGANAAMMQRGLERSE